MDIVSKKEMYDKLNRNQKNIFISMEILGCDKDRDSEDWYNMLEYSEKGAIELFRRIIDRDYVYKLNKKQKYKKGDKNEW